MLSHSFALYRQARTFSSLTAALCFRVCSSKLCKTIGFTKHHKPRLFDIFAPRGESSCKLVYRSVNTASCYFRESATSVGEQPSDTVKDETSNISDLHSDFYDEDAKISSRQPKPRSVVAEYKLDENGYLKIQDLVDFLKKESAIDICVIKTSGIRRSYVDYFVVVSGVSTRHIRAMAKNLEQLVGQYEAFTDWVVSLGKNILLEVIDKWTKRIIFNFTIWEVLFFFSGVDVNLHKDATRQRSTVYT